MDFSARVQQLADGKKLDADVIALLADMAHEVDEMRKALDALTGKKGAAPRGSRIINTRVNYGPSKGRKQ